MLAVAGLWIEQHKQFRQACLSFLRLYRQALRGFIVRAARLPSQASGVSVKKPGALDIVQVQGSPALGTYDRRELRMRW
jgi:hypothetical protein